MKYIDSVYNSGFHTEDSGYQFQRGLCRIYGGQSGILESIARYPGFHD
jgi:hypothetical protein